MDFGGDVGLPAGFLEPSNGAGLDEFNISDIIDAIHIADPSFSAAGAPVAAMLAPAPAQGQRPFVRIVEQPASKSLRFRYLCEGRSAGSIPGVNSTTEKKSYPTIEICNYKGPAIIVVSCVTATDNPPKTHPHNLVGREKCNKGVCSTKVTVTADNSTVSFPNLGIQCVKKKEIAAALRERERITVDPFKTGFGHKSQPQNIDLNAVRLCFQVFIPDKTTDKPIMSLPPVVSDVIYDKKAMSDPLIMRLSRCSGSVRGGDELIILCEKVTREEISVVFYLEEEGAETWAERGNILLVHKQVAIVVETPRYSGPQTTRQIHVNLKLQRSDGECSPPVKFEYIPLADDFLAGKKRKTGMLSYLQSIEQQRNFPTDNPIKSEPRDRTPPHQMYPAGDVTFQWQSPPNQGAGSMQLPGPSHLNPFHQWGGNMDYNIQPLQPIPTMQQMHSPIPGGMSPMQGGMSPMQGGMSPMQGGMSPMQGGMSPMHGGLSPIHGGVSPMQGVSMQGTVSPMHGGVSPMHGTVSPLHRIGGQMPVTSMQGGVSPLQTGMGVMQGDVSSMQGTVSPMHGAVSPNLVQAPNMMMHQQPMHQQAVGAMEAEGEGASISGLLRQSGPLPQFSEGDLTQLTQLLDGPPPPY